MWIIQSKKIYEEMGVTGCDTQMSAIICLLHHLHSLFFYLLVYVWNKLSPSCFLHFPCVFFSLCVYLMFRKDRLSLTDKELLMVVGALCGPSKSAFVVKMKISRAFSWNGEHHPSQQGQMEPFVFYFRGCLNKGIP